MPRAADPVLLTLKTPLGTRKTPVDPPERSRGNWFIEQRLRFIESRLFWHGTINRAEIVDQFKVHKAIASEDIAEYLAMAPRNAFYDKSAKVYRAGRQFLPVFRGSSVSSLVAHVALDDGHVSDAPYESSPSLERPAEPAVLRNIAAAIRGQFALHIFYRSMKNPDGEWRWIEPHALVTNGPRWHARAFCHERQDFRDFVLSRIVRGDVSRPGRTEAADDLQWSTIVDVTVEPHRALKGAQKHLIEHDHGMENGTKTIACRQALLWYCLRDLGLDREDQPPAQVLQLQDPVRIRRLAGFSENNGP